MVGLQNLDLPIGVRVPVSQPKTPSISSLRSRSVAWQFYIVRAPSVGRRASLDENVIGAMFANPKPHASS
jgi:hypothetical protein